jgi:hypothetical protein
MTEPASDVSFEFYNQTGKFLDLPITAEKLSDTKQFYCVAILKDEQYGYSGADYREEDDTSNTDIVLEDPLDESDFELMKNIALGRLQRRPTSAENFDPTHLVMGPRTKKIASEPEPFSVTIAQTLLQESFQRIFIQRSENGDVKRIICVVFTVRFCAHGATLGYGASINHADSGTKILESEIDAEVVKLMATARVRYEKFRKIVTVPKFCKLEMDKYLLNTVRKLGCFQKPAKSEYVVWNK